jgi:chromosome segregation ATPase
MSAQERPAAGELVVCNGKKAGTRVPLVLPVTVIGRAAGCDVRLTAAGVADLHCLIAVTPAGPVLRAWQPDHTLRNGTPATATLLQDGDELKVGPCVFSFHWHAEQVDGAPARVELPPDLLAQLSDARQAFRAERDRQTAELAEANAELDRRTQRVQKLREQAKAERAKSRQTYQRFLKRMKAKWSAERRAVESEQHRLDREAAALTAKTERFEAEWQTKTAELTEYKGRLTEAWHLLAENQRRLMADRQQVEAWLARQTQEIEQKSRLIDDRERRLTENQPLLETRAAALASEIAGLEARAANMRAALKQLEERRAALESSPAAGQSIEQLVVSLESQRFHPAVSQEADRLLSELHDSTQAVARERMKLATAREQLAREAADLADQRAVLAEQVGELAVARDLWQAGERTAVIELEELARGVRGREQAVEERERHLMDADRDRRQREYDLWQLRAKLEGWQAALAAHEAAAAAARDRTAAEQDAEHDRLARWEASLEQVQRAWADLRRREKEQLTAEADHWAEARQQLTAAITNTNEARTRYLDEAEKLAARVLAAEQQDGAEPRRMRVLRKRWESHFAKMRKDLDARRATLAAEQADADRRLAELQVRTAEWLDQHAERTERALTTDRGRLAANRAADEEQAVALSIEAARRERSEQALHDLRTEIERLSALLDAPSADADVVPLLALHRAA